MTCLSRPSVPVMDGILGEPFAILDHGFIRVVDYMGDEAAIVQAVRVSYGEGTKSVSDDRALIRYLMRNHHTTPFEMAELKLHVKMPIFVARQWLRHRTFRVNEVSARYSVLPREFHLPDATDLAPQSSTNRQGRADGYPAAVAEAIQNLMRTCGDNAFDAYDVLIGGGDGQAGVARETAREVLPLATYTEMYLKVDLHNLLHFLRLRLHPHAQHEIREYARVIHEILAGWLPNVMAVFDDYHLNAHTFSGPEMAALRVALTHISAGTKDRMLATLADMGASGREKMAFFHALAGGRT